MTLLNLIWFPQFWLCFLIAGKGKDFFLIIAARFSGNDQSRKGIGFWFLCVSHNMKQHMNIARASNTPINFPCAQTMFICDDPISKFPPDIHSRAIYWVPCLLSSRGATVELRPLCSILTSL